MTAPQTELQAAIYSRLTADPDLMLIISDVHDRVPEDATFPYISFGPSDEVGLDASCIIAGSHSIQIDVWSRAVGQGECKNICNMAKRLLHDDLPDLPVNALASFRVVSVRVMDDPNPLTTHGIITLEARIEER